MKGHGQTRTRHVRLPQLHLTIAPITSFATMIWSGEPYQQRTGVIGVKITSDFTK